MKLLPMDQLYGHVDLNSVVETGGDTFTAEQITANTVEPDIIIDEDLFSQEGNLQIENVLCWDVGEYHANCSGAPEGAGSENVRQNINAGLTKDNTVNVSDGPSSDIITEGTFPGGAEKTTATRFQRRWNHLDFTNDENAVGEINNGAFKPHIVDAPVRQRVKQSNAAGWFDVGDVLTAAHYHHWVDSLLTGSAIRVNLGIHARRMECDFLELQFDRQTILGILQAVNQVF